MLSLLTRQEVEWLASLISRASLTGIETQWANQVLARLRALADANKEGKPNEEPADQPGV